MSDPRKQIIAALPEPSNEISKLGAAIGGPAGAALVVAEQYAERIAELEGDVNQASRLAAEYLKQAELAAAALAEAKQTMLDHVEIQNALRAKLAEARKVPVAWIATSPLGTELRMAVADGWNVQVVMTVDEKDWNRPMTVDAALAKEQK